MFVIRSGIDARRLSPRVLSFKNPLIVSLSRKSSFQKFDNLSSPEMECSAISSQSSLNMLSVNILCKGTLFSGSVINFSTPFMRESYSASGLSIQYSKGLLLIAAMFQLATDSSDSSEESILRSIFSPPKDRICAIIFNYCTASALGS